MLDQQILSQFKQSFNYNKKTSFRGIGIECELPVVTDEGEAVGLSIIQNMFSHLETLGFELEIDNFSNLIIAATRKASGKLTKFDFNSHTITTDTGYSIVEVVLAPRRNLHDIEIQFNQLLEILTSYFDSVNCKILGYGIQPLTSPSRKLLMPTERYSFFEKLSSNHFIPKSVGADSSHLTFTASNQCHLQVGANDAISATNVINALSGLQIALQANSPIWAGEINSKYKASREMLWNYSFPERLNQLGIPPKFDSIEHYVSHILDFEPMVVMRKGRYMKILNKKTFRDFLKSETPVLVDALNGKKSIVHPRAADIHQLLPFVYFNARLAPKYGTIESRMCCQQPPNETLTSAALALGIIENLEAAQQLVNEYPIETWRELRQQCARHAFDARVDGKSIVPLLTRFLDLVSSGLKSRNLGEEKFLEPLYKRLRRRQTPADLAIRIFKKGGIEAFLEHFSFKNNSFKRASRAAQSMQHNLLTNND